LKLGRKFGIVTANASLLVLTTLDQYVKHHIKPSKEALPALYDEYLRYVKEKKVQEENAVKGLRVQKKKTTRINFLNF
jgi:hypothetical protein